MGGRLVEPPGNQVGDPHRADQLEPPGREEFKRGLESLAAPALPGTRPSEAVAATDTKRCA